ncbi:MAG TPA: DUF2189 domain-containing protein [Casimicrobiaceae bacterium]|nr:DUF2189 domain-containing protein [Casimicrobiaceae bacterium]
MVSQADLPAEETPAAADGPADIVLSRLTLADPLRWLALGWRDFRRCPLIGVFYGTCFMIMGWVLMEVYETAPAYVMALSAGFLLMGPFLCLGLYRASQHLERGEKPDLGDSLFAFEAKAGTLGIFGLVLLVLELLWGRATLVIFALSFDGMPDLRGSLLALASPANIGFTMAWITVGAVFAGTIFSISVVSIPMILDRQTDAITAGLTSLRVVLTQTRVMLLWGALITGLIALALLPWFAGLPIVGPVLGHASWHAYRAAVSNSAEAATAPREPAV